jgi:hypothetical protein
LIDFWCFNATFNATFNGMCVCYSALVKDQERKECRILVLAQGVIRIQTKTNKTKVILQEPQVNTLGWEK